jgi:hypothetical protein
MAAAGTAIAIGISRVGCVFAGYATQLRVDLLTAEERRVGARIVDGGATFHG